MRSFDIDEFNCLKNEWAEKKSEEFIKMVQNILDNDQFLTEVADSLAWSYYNEKDCNKLFDAFNLGHEHVVCYLNVKYSGYKEEMEAEFLKFVNYVDDDCMD